MIDVLKRLLGVAIEPTTRMTQEEVVVIAQRAAAGSGLVDDLTTTSIVRQDGRLTWIVATPTVGSGRTVAVDDATGVASLANDWGVR